MQDYLKHLSALAILLPVSLSHAGNVPTDRIVIDVIAGTGTGCPAALAVAVSPDNTAFTVSGAASTAQVGIGAQPGDSRKTCKLILRVHVPQGFVFGIASATYQGFASISPGATGFARENLLFAGQATRPLNERRFAGPFADEWQLVDQLAPPACGTQPDLIINTELRAEIGTSNPMTSTSFVSMDSFNGRAETTYNFLWQRCP